MPFGSTAALGLPGVGYVSLAEAAVFALWLALIVHRVTLGQILATLRPFRPGFPLLLLLIWAAIGAVFLPRLLAGATELFVFVRRDEGSAIILAPLAPFGTNLSQLARLALAASVFVALATVFRSQGNWRPVALALTVASFVHVALAILDLGSYAVGLPDLLDGLRTMDFAQLDNQVLLGIKRLTGGFPEASSFAYYTIGLYGFWLRRWFGEPDRIFFALMVLVMIGLLLRSTATSGYLSLGAYTLLFLFWQLGNLARTRQAMTLSLVLAIGVPTAAIALAFIYSFVPGAPEFIERTLIGKLTTASGLERLSWNAQALVNFRETFTLGAGIGSVRASSWLLAALGSLGLLGTALYLWFIGAALLQRPTVSENLTANAEIGAALQSGCAAIFVHSLLTKPYPNLEIPFFAMAGLAVGLLRQSWLRLSPLPENPAQFIRSRQSAA
ncbi:MAG: hypothetical protein AAF667_02075 [Pseudomonadota bacterium]